MSRTMRQVFGDALVEFAPDFPQMAVMDADVSSSTQTRIFQKAYPERFFNFGISEGNMAAAAAGMAACGKIPVISTFAFLLAGRAMDPIHSLIAFNNLNVKICGGYAGLSDYADGASHQSVCDIAMMRALPNMRILSPSDLESTRDAVRLMLRYNGPVYLRISRNEAESLHGGKIEVEFDTVNKIKSGRDVTLITTGMMLGETIRACEILQKRGIDAGIIEVISIKPLNDAMICAAAAETGRLVTIEEHSVIGGLGEAVCSAVCSHQPVPVLRIGIQDMYGQSARSYAQLLERYGLDSLHIADNVERFMRNRQKKWRTKR